MWTAKMSNPFVVKGDTIRSEREYTVKASENFRKGELIRIDVTGKVQKAANTTALAAGAVHGIAGADASEYLSGGAYAGQTIPVLLFSVNTVVAIQMAAAKDHDDYVVGQSYTLDRSTVDAAGMYWWTLTDTTAAGVAQIESKPSDDQWFDPSVAATVATAPIHVRFTQAMLDTRSAT